MCLISSYSHCLLPRFKGSHQELSKYIKIFQRSFCKENFQFLYLIAYLLFNVIHIIYVVKCPSSNVIILIATKNYMNFIFHFFVFSQFLQILISSWRLYHLVVFIAKLWDDNLILVMAFLLLKLCKFTYLSFLKSSLVFEKRFFFSFL